MRIEEVNPLLNAVTEINPDALSIAAALDTERANGTIRSPLHGLPMLIKNNIATKDQMNNTAGSYSLLGATVPRDATVAAKLRAAGVVLLGKSNLSQWANFRSSNSSSGWSAYGGQVTGAYHPDMDVCTIRSLLSHSFLTHMNSFYPRTFPKHCQLLQFVFRNSSLGNH